MSAHVGSPEWHDAHPDAPSWGEAQHDAWLDALDNADMARGRGDHVTADFYQQEADRLADEAWRRSGRNREDHR